MIYASKTGATNLEFEAVAEIGQPGQFIFKVTRLNQGGSYAYLASNTQEQDIRPASPAKNKTLYVLKNGQPVQILGAREIVDYSLNGNSLVIIGSLTNEPCGIWIHNLATAVLESAWRPLAAPKFSTLVTPEYHTISNLNGERLHYYLWPPVKVRDDKKYPVMICQSCYRWLAEAQVAANSGYYFAMAERPTFHSEKIENWPEDVRTVYKDLSKSQKIDVNRAFLFGTSAETGCVNGMLAEEPQVWKGAFLEGGTGPEARSGNGPAPELALIVGDHDEFNPLKGTVAYKETAARNGIPAKVVVRAGVHTALASSTQREIARLLAEFLHENQ